MSHTRSLQTQQKIANKIGASQSTVSYILRGDRTPSKDMAKSLEGATGICREAWVWPERHWNPYMPFNESNLCLHCANRVVRIRGIVDHAEECFKDNPDKMQALKDSVDYIYDFLGVRRRLIISVRRKVKDEWRLLYGGDENSPETINRDKWPVLTEMLDKGEIFHVPIHPTDLPENAVNERKMGNMLGTKTHITISYNGFSLSLTTLKDYVTWTPEMIRELDRFVKLTAENF